MKIYRIIFLIIVMLLCCANVHAQIYRTKPENFFGIQVKPLIPFGLVGDKAFDIVEDDFKTTVSPSVGYSYGGVVRIGLTELLAIETGLN